MQPSVQCVRDDDHRRLLDQLTLDQKVELLAGADTWHTAEFDDPPVPAIRMSDGPAGVRGTSWTGAASASFPCGAALGATWDPALVEQVGRALGREAHAKSAHVLLAPTVNLHRTPIGGRNFECPSEDPVLTAEVAVAYVRGVQHERVAACIKHFVGNDTEFERMTISSEIDERTLRELYLVPFEAAVRRAERPVDHDRLQQAQRHVLQRAPLAAGRRAARRVGLRRRRRQRLVRHATAPAASLLAGLDLEMPGPAARARRAPARRRRRRRGRARTTSTVRWPGCWRSAAWTGAGTTGTAEVTADDPETRAVIRRAATRGHGAAEERAGAAAAVAGDAAAWR